MTTESSTLRAASTVRGHPVVAFVGLTMVLSWVLWWPIAGGYLDGPIPETVAGFGPTIAAVVLTIVLHGRGGLSRLGRRLLRWRVHPGWYLFSVGFSPALLLVALGVYHLLGGAVPPLAVPSPMLVLVAFAFVLVTSVAGEELGWRGFMLPRLQRSVSALTASLLLGVVWFGWHLPLFFMREGFHRFIPLELFALQVVGFTVLYTWLFNNTDGNLLLPHLFHTANNVTFFLIPVLPTRADDATGPLWVGIGLLWVIVIGVVVLTGPRELARDTARVTYRE